MHFLPIHLRPAKARLLQLRLVKSKHAEREIDMTGRMVLSIVIALYCNSFAFHSIKPMVGPEGRSEATSLFNQYQKPHPYLIATYKNPS